MEEKSTVNKNTKKDPDSTVKGDLAENLVTTDLRFR